MPASGVPRPPLDRRLLRRAQKVVQLDEWQTVNVALRTFVAAFDFLKQNALRALAESHRRSKRGGTSGMSMAKIDKIIRSARAERRRRRK